MPRRMVPRDKDTSALARIPAYGEGFGTGPPQVGAGSLSFCEFPPLFVVSWGSRPVSIHFRPYFTQLYLRTLFMFSLSPHPPGGPE